VVVGALGAGEAQALLVTVNNRLWDVSTFTGTYDTNISNFNTAANGGVMPWWNDGTLAGLFTLAVGGQLGYQPTNSNRGPYFAYNYTSPIISWTYVRANQGNSIVNGDGGNGSTSHVWAQATEIVPGPLPLFGAAAAFGFSRKLRKRINRSKADGGSITTG
jgi:hypothetical protein